jgi:NAD(P)-dependent dehydrogenase (short-subunit alcohol dehydrogenase family)
LGFKYFTGHHSFVFSLEFKIDQNFALYCDEEVKAQFETNFFGQLKVTRAVLPHMRARKSGVIAFIGSVGGWRGLVGAGIYCAAKWALVSVTESLKLENAHLGIECTVIEPGYFRTNFLDGNSLITSAKVIDDLRPAMDPVRD